MRILTWNVNGLRAAVRKGIWDWIQSQAPEIICFQEIRTRPDQLSPEQHRLWRQYHAIWNPAQRPGYSGVATLMRTPFCSMTMGLGKQRFDVEGRVIRVDLGDFDLINIYCPSGKRDHSRVPFKLDFYAHLKSLCDSLHGTGRKLILCGDFNTAHREIDLRHPGNNQRTSGFLPEERAWIDAYLSSGFKDVYRVLYPDMEQYTWWTYRSAARDRNVGWRLDYFLVSDGMVGRVEDVVIHTDVGGSDHCPVSLILR